MVVQYRPQPKPLPKRRVRKWDPRGRRWTYVWQ